MCGTNDLRDIQSLKNKEKRISRQPNKKWSNLVSIIGPIQLIIFYKN